MPCSSWNPSLLYDVLISAGLRNSRAEDVHLAVQDTSDSIVRDVQSMKSSIIPSKSFRVDARVGLAAGVVGVIV